jgi:hypothetical protein
VPDLTRETLPTPEQCRPLIPVEAPVLGDTVYVRRLSMGDALDLPSDDPARFVALLALKSAHFADGSRIWANDQLETVLAFPGEDLRALVEQALKVNGIASARADAATQG